jgi:hypothetical protein
MAVDRRACHHLRVEGDEQTTGSDQPGHEEVVEVLDGEIVQAGTTPAVTAPPHSAPPATRAWQAAPVQTAVAAATGFIAGAATLALLRHYGLRAANRELDLAGDEQLRRGGEAAQLRGATYLVSIRPLQPPR